MGVKERKQREKEALKNLILKTATKQFATQGYYKTTIRSIAKAIEYSPRTIYLHFKDKDALLYEISIQAFTLFKQRFESVLSVKDPMKRLEKLNEVYINFALENPAYYELMFILDEPMRSEEAGSGWQIGLAAHKILSDIIRECQEQGYFKEMDIDVVAFSVWSYVHGLVSLHIRNRMLMYPEELRDHLIIESSKTIFKMLTLTR